MISSSFTGTAHSAQKPVCPGCVSRLHRSHKCEKLASAQEIAALERKLRETIPIMVAFFEAKEKTLGKNIRLVSRFFSLSWSGRRKESSNGGSAYARYTDRDG